MAIERIGSAGTISSVSGAAKSAEVQVAGTAVVSSSAKVEQREAVIQRDRRQEKNENQREQEIPTEKVKAAVDDLNKQVKQASPVHRTQLSFKYHDDTNRISITVTDSDTDEVIREIPPEKALDMLAKAWELAGLMVDERR